METLGSVILFATGAMLGAVSVWLLREREMHFLRTELTMASDRLLHAWKDGATIPPRPVEVAPPPPLPPQLMELVTEWESPEARATMEAKLRGLYFDRGWGVTAILKQQENEHEGHP